ncbi:MAG TPA: glycosyltransferase family 2 protein [Bryobacteraceae bacterium]|nr:glycosyltransferase family 2 protein [Bryobacteraceae bacterium]
MPDSAPPRAVLIIPALNEESAIGLTLDRVPRHLYRAVIVADNGSCDRTAAIARARGATVVSEPRRGYGAACLKALGHLPAETEAVVFMDADASDDPAEATLLLDPIFQGRADLVLGSRTLGRAEPGALQPHQALGNHLAAFLIRLLYGHPYTDLGPFRAIRVSALAQLGMRDRNYGWTVEMQIKALRRGLRVLEVPVSYRRRAGGASKVSGNLPASLLAGAKIIWTVFRLALRP